MSCPGATRELPAVDERVIAPKSGYELLDGELVRVGYADPSRSTYQARLSALLEAHVNEQFEVAIDMFTRTSELDDMVLAACVLAKKLEPYTGGRRLEELGFEIVNSKSLNDSKRKASKLTSRGVRRMFAIDVEQFRILEWSRDQWTAITNAFIEDPTLAVPLPIDALFGASKLDGTVAVARCCSPIKQSLDESAIALTAELLIVLLASRALYPQPHERARILRERDPELLERWIARVALCANIAGLLAT